MNRSIILIGFVCFAAVFQAQAYTFTVKNFTDEGHSITLQLKGLGQKPLESQVVEPYGATPSLFAQVKSKVQGWVNDLQKEWSDKLAQLSNDIDNAATAEKMEKKLAELQADIDKKIKSGMLKVGAKKWVNELNTFKNDVQKGIDKLDKERLAKNVKKLQSEMNQKLAELSNAESSTGLDTATFSLPLGDLRAGFCVNKIIIDDKPLTIYGVSPTEYDALQEAFKRNKNEYRDSIKRNIDAGNYTNLTSTVFGICFSRQFDIVDLGNGRLVIITKEKI